MIAFEKIAFIVGIGLVRKYALHVSWRKMVMAGSLLVTIFNMLYFLIIFDVLRNTWFYMSSDVSSSFMLVLNQFVGLVCMVEIAEPGFEAITYAMMTAANNAVVPLSAVISNQLLALFPLLSEQESIGTDTPQVRKEFALLQSLVIFINLSSLVALPLLPRQKKEARELVKGGERSRAWGKFLVYSLISFLCYSSLATLVTVKYHYDYGCLKVLGGKGCSDDESSAPALILVLLILSYCYGTNFYLSYLPVLRGKRMFSWKMFV